MTEEKFKTYLKVQNSGLTNMFDVNQVIALGEKFNNITLSKEDCLDIMKNYSKYQKEFELE